MSEFVVTTKYPNGSEESHHRIVPGIGWITAPSPFGTRWRMNVNSLGVHNQATGNPDEPGIHRRGRKWYLHFEQGIGYSWR